MDTARALEDEGAGRGQRRYVTVLFADVSDSSRLAEQLEAEEFSELLAGFRSIAREVIPRHGGNIARLQGDGLLALFGHLEAREDDGRRATEAALELHSRATELRVGAEADAAPLRLHSGIHGGLVLVIEGDIERGRFDVVGEVPNTAARLCSLAGTGEVLASEETLGPQARFFLATALRRLAIRGRAAPLNVLRIDGHAPLERRLEATAADGAVPFIGREDAMAELLDAAEAARKGEPSVVLLVGEPGIGKTRLVDEFRRRLDPAAFRVMQGYCESYLGAEPLQPFLQWMRAELGGGPGVAPEDPDGVLQPLLAQGEQAAKIAALVQSHLTPDSRKSPPNAELLVRAILDLIDLLASHRTLVLVLDDWQWADDASRVALQALLARHLPLMVLLASRPFSYDTDHPAFGAKVLQLQPLDAAEAAEAIAARLPLAHPFTVQEIYRQSGGTPLFIEELCHATARGEFHLTARRPGVAWINALVASRVARLPEEQAEILRAASVVGFVFAGWLLQSVAGGEQADLDALSSEHFFVAGSRPGELRFKHVLARDAVYATVPPARRRSLHLRVAQVLEQGVASDDAFEWLETLSYHYDSAGVRDKAAQFAESAGDKALATMALDRARAQYITALRSLDGLPDPAADLRLRWCAIAQKLGQACVFDPLDLADGFALFERAAEHARHAGAENAIARAEYWLAYMNYSRGRPKAAVQHAELALAHATNSNDEKLAVQVEATLGQALASAGQYGRALPLLAQSVERKRKNSRPGSGTAIGSAYTLARLGYTLADVGRFEESDAAFAESLLLVAGKVHSVAASILEVKCAAHLWQGRWVDAEDAARQGAEVALRCRSRWMVAMGRALGSCARWAADGDASALQMLREATQWIEEHGGAISTSLNYGWLVEATATLGLAGEARLHAARLFRRRRLSDRQGEAQGCRALARLALQANDAARVQHYLRQADAAADARGSPRERAMNALARAEFAALANARLDARARAEEAASGFAEMGMAWHLARARALLRNL